MILLMRCTQQHTLTRRRTRVIFHPVIKGFFVETENIKFLFLYYFSSLWTYVEYDGIFNWTEWAVYGAARVDSF